MLFPLIEVLQRRTSTKLNRNRGITLNDLIRHIEFYEKLEKKRELKDAIDSHKIKDEPQIFKNDNKRIFLI